MSLLLEDVRWIVEDTKLEFTEEAVLLSPTCCEEQEMDEWESIEHSLRDHGTAVEIEGVAEEIQTNLWLSVEYRKCGNAKLAKECAQAAFDVWRAYYDLLDATHGRRLRLAVVRRAINMHCSGAHRCLLTH